MIRVKAAEPGNGRGWFWCYYYVEHNCRANKTIYASWPIG